VLIDRIICRLPQLEEQELSRLAVRVEVLTSPRYGSAVAVEQVSRGEQPTGLDVQAPRARDTLPSGPPVESWDSRALSTEGG
jgi:hypothetical protein